MAEHLVDLRRKIGIPGHMEKNPFADLSSVFGDPQDRETFVNVDIHQGLPDLPSPALDHSQLRALERALTKRLAIVQGPPGTGKTHVSALVTKILHSRLSSVDPPVIVASHTNHALDNFLQHVNKFEPEFVRLGGGSTDVDVIKKRTIVELNRVKKFQPVVGGLHRQATALHRQVEKRMVDILAPFPTPDAPLAATVLVEKGLLSEAQHQPLQNGAATWVNAVQDDAASDPIARWLGDDLIQIERQHETDDLGFEYEEPDLEFEQLKELEAELGVSEGEKVDWLPGRWVPIHDHYTARHHPGVSRADVDKWMEMADLWKVPQHVRGAIYRRFQDAVKTSVLHKFRHEAKAYSNVVRDVKVGRWENDFQLLAKAKIIGVTTTGLSKYRALLTALKPQILIVEEAAEMLEGPIAAGMVESLQHLILVGDHKQLRGHCSVSDLEGEPFNLGMSMFERLVRNGVPFAALTRQRRMIPEIRRILMPIYDRLDDHPSVQGRADVPGMGGVNSYWLNHHAPESMDNFSSRQNIFEVKMVVGFFVYLVDNGVSPADVTVLTFYNGQRKAILKALKAHVKLKAHHVKVKTVDSYQGQLSAPCSNHF